LIAADLGGEGTGWLKNKKEKKEKKKNRKKNLRERGEEEAEAPGDVDTVKGRLKRWGVQGVVILEEK